MSAATPFSLAADPFFCCQIGHGYGRQPHTVDISRSIKERISHGATEIKENAIGTGKGDAVH